MCADSIVLKHHKNIKLVVMIGIIVMLFLCTTSLYSYSAGTTVGIFSVGVTSSQILVGNDVNTNVPINLAKSIVVNMVGLVVAGFVIVKTAQLTGDFKAVFFAIIVGIFIIVALNVVLV